MNNILLISTASIFTGFVFGAAFLSIARTLRRGTSIRHYLIVSAYGMFIFYLAASATVSQAAYLPFGLISVGFTGIFNIFDICWIILFSRYFISRFDFAKNN